MDASTLLYIAVYLVLFGYVPVSEAATVTTLAIVNNCSYKVWLGILSTDRPSNLSRAGFEVEANRSLALKVPNSWSGTIRGRRLCPEHGTENFSCVNGAENFSCVNGGVAAPPAVLADGKLNGADGLDFYNVSPIDICNLTMTAEPLGDSGGGAYCPGDLKVKSLGGKAGKEIVKNGQAYEEPSIETCSSSDCLFTLCPKDRKPRRSAKVPGTPSPIPQVPPLANSRKVSKASPPPHP